MKRGAGAGVIQRFLSFLAETGLSGTASGVAFSGGADSSALAICAAEAGRAGLLKPILVHVNHGVRPDSGRDLDVVRFTAHAIGLDLVEVTVDSLSSQSTEADMRDARYVALHDALANSGVNRVMTGHHARDQAETVLLHLARGQGAEGAAGITPLKRLTFRSISIEVVRPFLGEEPEELRSLVESRGLAVVNDPTNLEFDRARNLVRHSVLPVLSTVNPGAVHNIARSAEIARAEDEYLDDASGSALSLLTDNGTLLASKLADHAVAIQRRALRAWVHRETGLSLTFERTEALRAMALSGIGDAALQLGEHWTARQRKRRITLHRDIESSGSETGVGA
jgi:tRNA(Ile)-lysidine synthase